MSNHVDPVIGPYVVLPAVCRDYDSRAAVVARQVAALVSTHLPHISVEHVGSTAVPGCAGKGIVDLMIPVPGGELAKVKDLLDRFGFQHQTGRDPFPEDRPMRVGAWVHDDQTFFLHVHVIPEDSPEVAQMRCFRDRLSADASLMQAYVARKQAILATGVTDSLEYCYVKGEFVKAALQASP